MCYAYAETVPQPPSGAAQRAAQRGVHSHCAEWWRQDSRPVCAASGSLILAGQAWVRPVRDGAGGGWPFFPGPAVRGDIEQPISGKMTEVGASKQPARARLGATVTALAVLTLLLLLASGAWDSVRVPSMRAYRFAGLGHGAGRRHRWASGGGSEAQGAAGAAVPATCDLDVEHGPIAESCELFTDVCVDQVGCRAACMHPHPPGRRLNSRCRSRRQP